MLASEPWWHITLTGDTLTPRSLEERAEGGEHTTWDRLDPDILPSSSKSTVCVIHLLPLPGICSFRGSAEDGRVAGAENWSTR